MDIIIDLPAILRFFNQPFHIVLWGLFWTIGWIPVVFLFLWAFREFWLDFRQSQWGAKQQYVFLAIDIPRGNEQSPKAVENLFAYLAGPQKAPDLIEKWWKGQFQLWYSLEIVSIEGYTQFIIRSPRRYRNNVESAVYSQYPDAEITEINDYTGDIPRKYPDPEYDVYGCEFVPVKHWAYPIKTYKDFEHQFGRPETHFKDPMATLMDLCSSLGRGEQLWYQILVRPMGFDWPKECDKEVGRILGESTSGSAGILGFLGEGLSAWMDIFKHVILGSEVTAKKEDAKDSFRMFNLKPSEKKKIDAIHYKGGKLGFDCKIRFVYLAKKEVFNKAKVREGFFGYMKQFMDLDLNNLKPDTKLTGVHAHYFLMDYRKNLKKGKIVRNYMLRSMWMGKMWYVLNIEELASIWHFPIEPVVRAPLIQKAPGRKGEPPMGLPESRKSTEAPASDMLFEQGIKPKISSPRVSVPDDIPVVQLSAESEGPADRTEPEFETVAPKEAPSAEKPIPRGAPPGNLPVA